MGTSFGRATPAHLAGGAGDTQRSGYGPGWRRLAERRGSEETEHYLPTGKSAEFATGDRVFHQKFGMGDVVHVDGDKLEIAFDRAGRKKVVAGFDSKP